MDKQIKEVFKNGFYCIEPCPEIKEIQAELKRKEQECERLKEGYSELTDIVSPYMDDFTGYNEELGGFDIVLCVKELMEQLNQLKAENEILKEKITISSNSDKRTLKIIQTLTEIKPILELYAISKVGEEQADGTYKVMLSSGYVMVYDPKPAKQALQKISECEATNER